MAQLEPNKSPLSQLREWSRIPSATIPWSTNCGPGARTSDDIFETCAALRRNVLDAFADSGVEIMTPTILSHRDASDLAVPTERFPNRSQPAGIRIAVDPK